MLKPSMQELMKKIGNRYLLVNLAAQRARDLAEEATETGEPMPDKAVKLALDEIVHDEIIYCPGPRIVEPEFRIQTDVLLPLAMDLDDEDEDGEEKDEEKGDDDNDQIFEDDDK